MLPASLVALLSLGLDVEALGARPAWFLSLYPDVRDLCLVEKDLLKYETSGKCKNIRHFNSQKQFISSSMLLYL